MHASAKQLAVTVVVLFGALPGGRRLAAAETLIETEHALATIENLGRKFESARWHVKSVSGNFNDRGDPDSIGPSKGAMSATVVFEPAVSRYRIEAEGTEVWVDGTDPFASMRQICTYDGELHRRWELMQAGTKLPDSSDRAGSGRIQKDLGGAQSCLEALAGVSGMQLFPPMFPTLQSAVPVSLADFLRGNQRAGKPLSVVEDGAGDWRIDTIDNDHLVRIRYSPQKRGSVLGVEWAGADEGGRWNDDYIWLRAEIVPQQIGDFWVPKTCTIQYTKDRPPQGHRLEFSAVVINEPVPPETYEIKFPTGTNLINYVSQKAYIVSGGPVDDQVAVRAFMERQGLGLSPVSDPSSRPNWALAASAGAVLAIIGVLLFAMRRRRRAAAVLLCAVAQFSATAVSRGDDSLGQDGWTLSHAPWEQIRVSQCG